MTTPPIPADAQWIIVRCSGCGQRRTVYTVTHGVCSCGRELVPTGEPAFEEVKGSYLEDWVRLNNFTRDLPRFSG